MHYDYDGLLGAAAEMEEFSGYLDGEEAKAAQQATAAFNGARNRFVYDALASGDDPEEIKARIVGDLDGLAEENPGWAGPAYVVRDELLARIDQESTKNPTWRKVVRYTPIALGVIAVAAYFGTKFYNDIDLSAPYDTPAGVAASAEALEKTLRYDDWASTRARRGGAIKSLLLWPISPSDLEVQAAQDLAGFAFSSEAFFREEQIPCQYTTAGYGDELSESQTAFLEGFAERLQSDAIEWEDDVQITMLVEAGNQLSCPQMDASDFAIDADETVPEAAEE